MQCLYVEFVCDHHSMTVYVLPIKYIIRSVLTQCIIICTNAMFVFRMCVYIINCAYILHRYIDTCMYLYSTEQVRQRSQRQDAAQDEAGGRGGTSGARSEPRLRSQGQREQQVMIGRSSVP